MEDTRTIACKLTAPELRERRATVIAELKAEVRTRTELEGGVRYEFDGSDTILDKLIHFIKSERLCCDFFTFRLTVENDNAIMEITGPNGAREFLREEVGL